MKRYRIIISPRVIESIADYRDYIAHSSGHSRIAATWVERVLASFDHLRTMPAKFALAEENDSRPYELRQMLIGKYVAVYTIDEEYCVVRILNFRHGSRLPHRGDLPDTPPANPA